jgi:hypothetical protein
MFFPQKAGEEAGVAGLAVVSAKVAVFAVREWRAEMVA